MCKFKCAAYRTPLLTCIFFTIHGVMNQGTCYIKVPHTLLNDGSQRNGVNWHTITTNVLKKGPSNNALPLHTVPPHRLS